jgi:nitrile hydratase subunit alpha
MLMTNCSSIGDSIAERRFMVIPQRPKNTEHLTEEQLAELVTRDSLIGTEILTYK